MLVADNSFIAGRRQFRSCFPDDSTCIQNDCIDRLPYFFYCFSHRIRIRNVPDNNFEDLFPGLRFELLFC